MHLLSSLYSLEAWLAMRMARFLARDSERRSRCSLRRCWGQIWKQRQQQGRDRLGVREIKQNDTGRHHAGCLLMSPALIKTTDPTWTLPDLESQNPPA
jgi:hypothetical protein